MRTPFNVQVVNTIPRFVVVKPFQRVNSISTLVRPTFGATVNLDLSLGDFFLIVATSNIAFTIANPTNDPGEGCTLSIGIANNSGGVLGAITFGTKFKTQAGIAFPANGQYREYDFTKINGLAGAGDSWEMHSSGADVPNPT